MLGIAYANIANLMVARASERQREIGIRAALGASRLRIVRQLVVESLVVSLIGAGVGLVLAWWAVEGLRAAMPDGVPRVVTVALDLRVFAAAVGGAVVSGVVFGLVPAGGCSRPVLTHVLQDGARGATAGRARQRLRSTLVVSEIALAVVLLIGAGLFLVSFVNLMRVDVGFDPAGVLTAWVAPQPDGEMTDRASVALTDTVDRVRQIRDVEAVAAVSGTSPAGTGVAAIKIVIPGRTRDGGEQVLAAIVTPDYHRVLRIPLHAGRYFDEGDRRGSEPVVLLGAATVRQYFPGADPVGDVIDVNGTRRQIVGVVGDIRPYRDWQLVSALVYLPVTQHPIGGSHLLIRTTGDPLAPLPLVRAAVAGVLPDVPVRDADALETIMARRAAQRRLSMLLLGVFGVLGLGIALVGVYGLLAYVVTQRTHEVGVRRALGATRMAVTSLLLRRTVTLVGLGLAAGGFAAWGVSTTTKAFLFQLGPTDARIFGGALTVVALCSLVAAALPASRAARGDPMVALRVE